MMKLPANTKVNPNTKRSVIPIKRSEANTLEKGHYHMYSLCTSPTSVDSPVYKLAILFFDNGLAEEWIKFWRNLEAVLKGQNVTSGPAKYAVAKTLLKGDALMIFAAAETSYNTVSVGNFEICLEIF